MAGKRCRVARYGRRCCRARYVDLMNEGPGPAPSHRRVRKSFARGVFRTRQAVSLAIAWLTHNRDASFTIELATPLTPDEALARVLDLRAHDKVIPLTRVSPAVPAEDLRPGSVFVGRTGIGPLAFDDPMMIERIGALGDAGGTGAVIVKQGRVLQGKVNLQITPDAPGSRVRWRQDVRLPWLPGIVQPLAARVLRLGYRQVLARLLAG